MRYRIVAEHLPGIAKASAGKGGLIRNPDQGKDWLARTAPAAAEKTTVGVSDSLLADAYKRYPENLKKKR